MQTLQIFAKWDGGGVECRWDGGGGGEGVKGGKEEEGTSDTYSVLLLLLQFIQLFLQSCFHVRHLVHMLRFLVLQTKLQLVDLGLVVHD